MRKNHLTTRVYNTRYKHLDFKGMGMADRVPLQLPVADMYVPLKARIELPDGDTWSHELRLAGRKMAMLALMTILQFVEGLTDRQAADAVQGRIDWKYALGLELTDSGFHYSVLSEFRTRLVTGGAEERLFTTLLQLFQARGLVRAGGCQRTDSTHVLATIRQLNRYELVGESLRNALTQLAQLAPDWLKTVVRADWYERYDRHFDSFHLPESREKRHTLAQQIGTDGNWLKAQAFAADAPTCVRSAQCLEALRQIWIQQCYIENAGAESQVMLRSADALPPVKQRICSPYDLDARYARHNDKEWIGFRILLLTHSVSKNPNKVGLFCLAARPRPCYAMPWIFDLGKVL